MGLEGGVGVTTTLPDNIEVEDDSQLIFRKLGVYLQKTRTRKTIGDGETFSVTDCHRLISFSEVISWWSGPRAVGLVRSSGPWLCSGAQ